LDSKTPGNQVGNKIYLKIELCCIENWSSTSEKVFGISQTLLLQGK
jgi:hypothetical protein